MDDYFAPDRAANAEQAMKNFCALTRMLLGDDVISDDKTEVGNPLVVLGI